MTGEEAKEVLRIALEGAAKQDVDEDRIKFMAVHLGPLPFEPTRRRVHEYVLSHRWLSSIEELLDAAGVSTSARVDLARAIHEGGDLLPSLRSMSGWEYVPPEGEVPRGVGEFYANADRPMPLAGRTVSFALPAAVGDRLADVPAELAGDALTSIGRGLQAQKNAALRRAFEQRQHPPAPFVPDRDAMPIVLREAVEAAETALDRATQAERRCQAQERAYRELCDEMADRVRDGAPDAATAQTVAVELLQRLAADPGYGLTACAEVLRDALIPGAAVAVKPEYGPNPDPFEDTLGPLVELRIALKRSV